MVDSKENYKFDLGVKGLKLTLDQKWCTVKCAHRHIFL